MNNKEQKLKKLAIIAAASNNIPADIQEYVLNYLGKQDVKVFLRFYRSALDKKRIYISSAGSLTVATESLLKNTYKGKEIVVDIDPSLGAGLRIRENDTIVDFTFKKYIDETIETLKD